MKEEDRTTEGELNDELEIDGTFDGEDTTEIELPKPTSRSGGAWRRIEALRERRRLKEEFGLGDDELDELLDGT
jgi:hypothetical protein